MAPTVVGCSGQRIGLLGGSFNPAHDGHVQISLLALKRLRLDQIRWLVSPPESAQIADRHGADGGKTCIREPNCDPPPHTCQRYRAAPSVAIHGRHHRPLRRRQPADRFVWLMGADNLIQLPKWRRWTDLMEAVPLAVFNRPGYGYRAIAGRAAFRYQSARLPLAQATGLVDRIAPAWVFFNDADFAISATEIRNWQHGAGCASLVGPGKAT